MPHNIGEHPEDYTPERDPVTMACHPGEAYFVIQDLEHPEREMRDSKAFAKLRQEWNGATISRPGQRWTPLDERDRNG